MQLEWLKSVAQTSYPLSVIEKAPGTIPPFVTQFHSERNSTLFSHVMNCNAREIILTNSPLFSHVVMNCNVREIILTNSTLFLHVMNCNVREILNPSQHCDHKIESFFVPLIMFLRYCLSDS